MVTAGNTGSLSMRWLETNRGHQWACGPYIVLRDAGGYTVIACGTAQGQPLEGGEYVWHVGRSHSLDGAKKQARKHTRLLKRKRGDRRRKVPR